MSPRSGLQEIVLRQGLLRFLSAALGTLLGLLLAEGATRLLAPWALSLSNPLVRFDPQLGWLYRETPGLQKEPLTRVNEAHEAVTLRGNRLGLRDTPHGYSTDQETVLVLGDSFTAGTQLDLEEAWPAQVELRLRGRHPRLQVVNAAVDGYDLAQEYRLAERLLEYFRPRVIVVGLYAGNDIVDYGRDAQARPPWEPSGPLVWLREHSYLYHLVSGAVRLAEERTTTRRRGLAPVLPGWDPRVLPGLSDLTPEQQNRIRGQFASPDLLPVVRGGPEADRRLRSTERCLAAFAELAQAHRAGFVVVLIPSKQQVVPDHRSEWIRLQELSRDQVDFPERELARWALERGVSALDLGRVFSESADPGSLFWRVDMHLSPAGHSLIGGALAPLVEQALR
jgi:hypothetical protein